MDEAAQAQQITQLLHDARDGDADARDKLLNLVHEDIARIARHHLRSENPSAMLETAELVNEAYLRLFPEHPLDWQDRTHFFAYVARAMRHYLVDQARRRRANKRGGGLFRVTLTDVAVEQDSQDLIELDTALNALANIDARKSRLIELRFFAGLSIDELCTLMELSPAMIHRELKAARGWLYRELGDRR